ncbi:MAG: ArsR family transcriptional regulator [Mycoplasmoidaceae bacterium]|nr:ArsR family transcriptional regulator [Mycoplasmoidaceae bacterium]
MVEFKITQPTLSFHLSKLENGDMIKVKKIGQSHHYFANVDLLEEMCLYGQKALKLNKNSR